MKRYALLLFPALLCAQEEDLDAFGSRIGVESLGLYSESQVRGFNLQEAGNYRLDGVYFVRAAGPSDVILSSLQIKVGPSALDLDFPAPSGVVAYRLLPGDRDRTDVEMGFQHLTDSNPRPYMRAFATRRLAEGRFSISGGWIAADTARYIYGNEARYNGIGFIPRWQIGDRWNLTAFASRYEQRFQADNGFIPAAGQALPQLERLRYLGQHWSAFDTRNENHGAVLTTQPRDAAWDYSLSSIHSKVDRPRSDFNIFRDVAEDGTALASVVVARNRSVSSWAHEITARRDWISDSHRAELAFLGRVRESDYVDPVTQSMDLGRVSLGSAPPVFAEPAAPVSGKHGSSTVDQREAGMGLRYVYRSGMAVNVGGRRVHVEDESRSSDGIVTGRSSASWLYNASLAIPLIETLTAFIATTRGLEEAGTAPQNAANRYEVLEPILARQAEAGLHWRPADKLTAIATLFNIEKLEPGFDADNIYRYLSTVRHRGAETSWTAQISDNWNVVLGGLWMRPELSSGLRPVGRSARVGWLSFEHKTPWLPGLSIDADGIYNGPRFATPDNRFETPGYLLINAGLRYRFTFRTVPAALRLRIYNLTDKYAWYASPSGIQSYEPERRAMLSVMLGQ
jgi:iron complex outermembrane recepter protein